MLRVFEVLQLHSALFIVCVFCKVVCLIYYL